MPHSVAGWKTPRFMAGKTASQTARSGLKGIGYCMKAWRFYFIADKISNRQLFETTDVVSIKNQRIMNI